MVIWCCFFLNLSDHLSLAPCQSFSANTRIVRASPFPKLPHLACITFVLYHTAWRCVIACRCVMSSSFQEAWENVDSTEAECPKCSHKRAYFMQIQTRSADEPMTTFYKCCNVKCNNQWRE
jgi:hypothetical protein